MGKYLERAKELRASNERHYNCTQAVVMPFSELLGIDEETAFRLGSNFGSGMRTGSVCGAITGGLMVLGMLGKDKPSDATGFIRRIRDNHEGRTMCADLLRVNAQRGGNTVTGWSMNPWKFLKNCSVYRKQNRRFADW